MRLATSNEQIQTQGLRGALARCLRPAVGFAQPRDVLKDPDLSHCEKRAVLASWASDASAVQDEPGLRWLLGAPRLWQTCGSPDSFYMAGEMGVGALGTTLLSPKRMAQGQEIGFEEAHDALEPLDSVVIGDPEHCVEKLKAYEAIAADRMMCLVQYGSIPHEAVVRCLQLAGEHLIPAFAGKHAVSA